MSKIPKIIHYCWFGGNPYPPIVERCMKTWTEKLPGWEIVRWDESNSPVHIPFVKKALENKLYAFAADYVRFHALFKHGGVYLDTDIEIVKDLSPLCYLDAFAAPEDLQNKFINAAVFGAMKDHDLTKDLLCFYEVYARRKLETVPQIVSEVLSKKEYNIAILPRDSFYPYNPYDEDQYVKQLFSEDITDNTFAIHHWLKSWTIPKPTKRQKWINSLIKRNPFIKNKNLF